MTQLDHGLSPDHRSGRAESQARTAPAWRKGVAARAELIAVMVLTAAAAIALQAYAFNGDLSEYDLYSHALGLWDGRRTGAGLASPLHYYSWLNYGYIQLAYLVGGDWAFADRASVIGLINGIGVVSTIAIVPLCWLTLRLAYGAGAAMAGLLVFLLSPTFLDIAGAGHPVLPALALFLAGAAALFARAQGPARLALLAFATVMLAASLMVRMELAFAFPLLVLTQPGAETPRAFLRRAAETLVPCLVAIGLFFVVRRLLLGTSASGASAAFVDQWYRLSNIPKGVGAAALAVGLGSWTAFAAALACEARGLIRAGLSPSRWLPFGYLVAGLAVIAVAMVFWLPNPVPARHFLLAALAVAIVSAVFIARRFRLSWPAMAAIGLLIAGANQAGAAAMAPVFARLSPSELAQPIGVLVPAPAGDALTRRTVLKARAEQVRELAEKIVESRCHRDLVVINGEAPALVSAFLRPGPRPVVRLAAYHGRAFTYTVRQGGATVTYLQTWTPDATLTHVLADPRFADAGILIDPLTRVATQRREPPPERTETLSCGS